MYLGVPDVEYAGVGGPDDLEAAPDVLAVQEHILQSPARHLVLEPSHSQEVRPVNTHTSSVSKYRVFTEKVRGTGGRMTITLNRRVQQVVHRTLHEH